jgi:mercuric ion transport protein
VTIPAATLRRWLGTLPAIAVSLAPKLACPACWPAYAGLLGALGLSFLTQGKYLFWLNISLLAGALCALIVPVRRTGYGPFLAGLAAAGLLLAGKFAWESKFLLWCGAAMLVVSSVWSAFRAARRTAVCSVCTDQKAHE